MCLVTITNIGTEPLLLNKRLAVSYPDDLCDVYFDIHKEGKRYIGTDEYDVSSRPESLVSEHYQVVPANGTLITRIYLDKYYKFPVGTYHICAIYKPQANVKHGKDAWSGLARSNEIVLEVL